PDAGLPGGRRAAAKGDGKADPAGGGGARSGFWRRGGDGLCVERVAAGSVAVVRTVSKRCGVARSAATMGDNGGDDRISAPDADRAVATAGSAATRDAAVAGQAQRREVERCSRGRS